MSLMSLHFYSVKFTPVFLSDPSLIMMATVVSNSLTDWLTRFGNSLLQIWELRFGNKAVYKLSTRFGQDFGVEVQAKLS